MSTVRTPFLTCLCGARFDASRGNRCPACGEFVHANPNYLRVGTESTHACDARCQTATGPTCHCECRGQNHGVAAGAH